MRPKLGRTRLGGSRKMAALGSRLLIFYCPHHTCILAAGKVLFYDSMDVYYASSFTVSRLKKAEKVIDKKVSVD